MFYKRSKNLITFLFAMALVFTLTFAFATADTYADTPTAPKPEAPKIVNIEKDASINSIKIVWNIPDDMPYDRIDIYRCLSKDGNYEKVDDAYDDSYLDLDVQKGVTYYYKLIAVYYDEENMEYIESEPAYTEECRIPLDVPNLISATAGNSHSITLIWNYTADCDGYAIYRSTSANGTYDFVTTQTATADSWYTSDNQTFTDKNLTVGTIYYYKIKPYIIHEGIMYYNDFSNSQSAQVTINGTVIKSASSKKKKTNTLTWKKNSEADGYILYYSKKANGPFKKLKTIKGNGITQYTHKKLTNGTAYYYRLVAYKNFKGTQLLGLAEVYEKYCDYYSYKNESYESKCRRIFGKSYRGYYRSNKKASKNMKTVVVKVWDKTGGKKFTRRFYLSVHKNIAPSVREMFKEIYKSKEKFPIHEMGCYSWRGKGSSSEHCVGLAFDINSNENYMIDHGKVLAGSFWKPKKSRYSIPLNCKLVKIMEKYGFTRGFWGKRKDYMHFSYLGT